MQQDKQHNQDGDGDSELVFQMMKHQWFRKVSAKDKKIIEGELLLKNNNRNLYTEPTS